LYLSTLVLRVIQKKKSAGEPEDEVPAVPPSSRGGLSLPLTLQSSYLRLIDSCITQLKAQGPVTKVKKKKKTLQK